MKFKQLLNIMLCGAMVVGFVACDNNNEPELNNNGSEQTKPSDNNNGNNPNLNGHEYVDLGLPSGTLWATCNIGASSTDEIGDYFAWGEVETKSSYTWGSDYKWGVWDDNDKTNYGITKYNQTDGKTILDLSDDAAYVNWGDKWRMPTREEQEELLEKCEIEWSYVRNKAGEAVNGYKLTGPNGNSIFFPIATGLYDGSVLYNQEQEDGGYAYYWSSSMYIYEDGDFYISSAAQLVMCLPSDGENNVWVEKRSRHYGCPIRPVCFSK